MVKYERSPVTTNVPRPRPGSMPEKELRNKINGLYDSFFGGVCDFLPEGRRLQAGCQGKFSVLRLLVSAP